jgi:dihydroneopterin aldolase
MAQNLDLNINVNTDQAGKSVGSLKSQLREAQAEVAALADKFGATSKEAIEAAKRAGELKDRIGDAKALTEAFNPDAKFKALTASLSGVAGGFAAVQGAMSLFGSESEDVQKTLLKVQSAMALSQGLQAVGESIDSFKQLGAVIKSTTVFQELNNAATATASVVQRAFGVATVQTSNGFKVLKGAIIATGFGALVVLLGSVIANFDAISDWIKKSPLGALAKGVGDLVTQFTDFIGVTSKAERSLNKLSSANKRANEDIENRIKVLKAQGGSEKEIYDLSQQRINNELNSLRASLKTKGKLTEEEYKQFSDLKTEQLVLTAEFNKKIADDNAKAAEDASKKRKEYQEKKERDEKAAEEKRQKEILDKQKWDLEKKQYQLGIDKEEREYGQKLIDDAANADAEREAKATKDKEDALKYRTQLVIDNFNREKNLKELDKLNDDILAKAKIDNLNAIGNATQTLGAIIGDQTKAGKALGVASALINTYTGATEVIRAKSTLPEPFGTIQKIASVAAIIATGMRAVKSITAVQVPGGGGGGGASVPSISTQAPILPQLPSAQMTQLNQQSINDLGNQAVRAYVIETDVTGNQQRMAAIRQRARFS